MRHRYAADRLTDETDREADARIEAAHRHDREIPDYAAQSSRGEHDADNRIGKAAQILQHRRKQHHRYERQCAEHKSENQAEREISIQQKSGRQKRFRRGQAVDDENIKGDRGQGRFHDDFDRREPIFPLAPVDQSAMLLEAASRARAIAKQGLEVAILTAADTACVLTDQHNCYADGPAAATAAAVVFVPRLDLGAATAAAKGRSEALLYTQFKLVESTPLWEIWVRRGASVPANLLPASNATFYR